MSVLHRLMETGLERSAIDWCEGQAIEETEELDLHHPVSGHGEARGRDRAGKARGQGRRRGGPLHEGRDRGEALQGGELGDYGISKDHRCDCKQVVLRTVADKGMISRDNVTELVKMDWEYILGARHRNCAEVMEWIVADDSPVRLEKIERDGGKEPFYVEVKEVLMKDSEEEKKKKAKKGQEPYPPSRYVMCRTQRQVSRDAAVRRKIVAGLEERLRTDTKSLVADKGYSRYLKTRAGGMEVGYAKIEREVKLDGIWVLQINRCAPAARIA